MTPSNEAASIGLVITRKGNMTPIVQLRLFYYSLRNFTSTVSSPYTLLEEIVCPILHQQQMNRLPFPRFHSNLHAENDFEKKASLASTWERPKSLASFPRTQIEFLVSPERYPNLGKLLVNADGQRGIPNSPTEVGRFPTTLEGLRRPIPMINKGAL